MIYYGKTLSSSGPKLTAVHIHLALFQDVYDWAGKLRTVDISRGNSRFANVLLGSNFLWTYLDFRSRIRL